LTKYQLAAEFPTEWKSNTNFKVIMNVDVEAAPAGSDIIARAHAQMEANAEEKRAEDEERELRKQKRREKEEERKQFEIPREENVDLVKLSGPSEEELEADRREKMEQIRRMKEEQVKKISVADLDNIPTNEKLLALRKSFNPAMNQIAHCMKLI
jgi:hypothetical protein